MMRSRLYTRLLDAEPPVGGGGGDTSVADQINALAGLSPEPEPTGTPAAPQEPTGDAPQGQVAQSSSQPLEPTEVAGSGTTGAGNNEGTTTGSPQLSYEELLARYDALLEASGQNLNIKLPDEDLPTAQPQQVLQPQPQPQPIVPGKEFEWLDADTFANAFDSVENFQKVLARSNEIAIQKAMASVPQISYHMAAVAINAERTANNYFQINQDLKPFESVMGRVSADLMARNPGWNLEKSLVEAGNLVRKELKLNAKPIVQSSQRNPGLAPKAGSSPARPSGLPQSIKQEILSLADVTPMP